MTRGRLSEQSEVGRKYTNRSLPEESACQIVLRQMFSQMLSVWHTNVALSFNFGTHTNNSQNHPFYSIFYREKRQVHVHVFYDFQSADVQIVLKMFYCLRTFPSNPPFFLTPSPFFRITSNTSAVLFPSPLPSPYTAPDLFSTPKGCVSLPVLSSLPPHLTLSLCPLHLLPLPLFTHSFQYLRFSSLTSFSAHITLIHSHRLSSTFSGSSSHASGQLLKNDISCVAFGT